VDWAEWGPSNDGKFAKGRAHHKGSALTKVTTDTTLLYGFVTHGKRHYLVVQQVINNANDTVRQSMNDQRDKLPAATRKGIYAAGNSGSRFFVAVHIETVPSSNPPAEPTEAMQASMIAIGLYMDNARTSMLGCGE